MITPFHRHRIPVHCQMTDLEFNTSPSAEECLHELADRVTTRQSRIRRADAELGVVGEVTHDPVDIVMTLCGHLGPDYLLSAIA